MAASPLNDASRKAQIIVSVASQIHEWLATEAPPSKLRPPPLRNRGLSYLSNSVETVTPGVPLSRSLGEVRDVMSRPSGDSCIWAQFRAPGWRLENREQRLPAPGQALSCFVSSCLAGTSDVWPDGWGDAQAALFCGGI